MEIIITFICYFGYVLVIAFALKMAEWIADFIF